MLVLIVLSVALALAGDSGRDWGRYERTAIEAGELWRLVTGHIVHLGTSHLALNLAALALIRLLVDDALDTIDLVGALLVSTVTIDLGLYLLEPDVRWYVGLSGVLHGLLAAGGLALVRPYPALGALLVAGLAAKLAWEQAVGPLPFSESTTGGPVVVASHLYGAAGGGAYGAYLLAVRGRRAASL